MKAIVSVCLFALMSAALARPGDDGKTYDDKYDKVDLDEILGSDRLLNGYFKCIMGQGPCTADGNELKEHIPDGLETGCSKCNPKQKEGVEKVIRFLIHNKEAMWNELKAKYDPTGEFSKKYEAEYEKLKNKKE